MPWRTGWTEPAADGEEAIRALPWPAAFSPEEKAALTECLLGLFSPEKESQLRALQRAGEQWRRFSLATRESREKNAALYRKLGWLAGAAVFILLC
ncbi:MAG: stage III sporulation protein AB [Clostridiales bacterium]|nr:stage III sporulation protein AB [Clostridiales bacterium]